MQRRKLMKRSPPRKKKPHRMPKKKIGAPCRNASWQIARNRLNDEARMTKSEGMTKHEIKNTSLHLADHANIRRQGFVDIRHSELVIVSSFELRHSSFSS